MAKTLEKYEIKESGYHPFLIRDGWQVAQLNFDINQEVENIKKLDIHNHTDEVFILLKGTAVLITATCISRSRIFLTVENQR